MPAVSTRILFQIQQRDLPGGVDLQIQPAQFLAVTFHAHQHAAVIGNRLPKPVVRVPRNHHADVRYGM